MSDFSSYNKQFKDTAHDIESSIGRLSRMNAGLFYLSKYILEWRLIKMKPKDDKKHAIHHINKEIEECERNVSIY